MPASAGYKAVIGGDTVARLKRAFLKASARLASQAEAHGVPWALRAYLDVARQRAMAGGLAPAHRSVNRNVWRLRTVSQNRQISAFGVLAQLTTIRSDASPT